MTSTQILSACHTSRSRERIASKILCQLIPTAYVYLNTDTDGNVTMTRHASIHFILLFVTIFTSPANAASSLTTGTVVQFVVYAEEQADVTRVFPGASVDFTWNNVFVVSIWTNDAARLIPDIKQALIAHEVEIQTLVPPYTMAAATQKWLEYNLIWVCLLVFVFIAGCACGGVLLSKCMTIKRQHNTQSKGCRTRY